MRQPKTSKGVFHQTHSEQHYNLHRLTPDKELSDTIEQFWWVSWDLDEHIHIQQNLPDPCVNLVFSETGAVLYGPVSKKFCYPLTNSGWLLGVKFTPAGYQGLTRSNMVKLVDQVQPIDNWLGQDVVKLCKPIPNEDEFSYRKALLQSLVSKVAKPMTTEALALNEIVMSITEDTKLFKVNVLAARFGVSVKTLQRHFRKYLGLTPKWVIKKCRMQEVITRLDTSDVDWQMLIEELGYFDQSHFIKEFKLMTGQTPVAFKNQ